MYDGVQKVDGESLAKWSTCCAAPASWKEKSQDNISKYIQTLQLERWQDKYKNISKLGTVVELLRSAPFVKTWLERYILLYNRYKYILKPTCTFTLRAWQSGRLAFQHRPHKLYRLERYMTKKIYFVLHHRQIYLVKIRHTVFIIEKKIYNFEDWFLMKKKSLPKMKVDRVCVWQSGPIGQVSR